MIFIHHQRKSFRDLSSFPLPLANSSRFLFKSLSRRSSIQFLNKVRKNSLLVAYLPVSTSCSTALARVVGREMLITERITFCITNYYNDNLTKSFIVVNT